MTDVTVVKLLVETFQTMGMIAAPVVIATIFVGVTVNILQTVTQIRDPALAFIPKVVTASVVIIIFSPWYIRVLTAFFKMIIKRMSEVT